MERGEPFERISGAPVGRELRLEKSDMKVRVRIYTIRMSWNHLG